MQYAQIRPDLPKMKQPEGTMSAYSSSSIFSGIIARLKKNTKTQSQTNLSALLYKDLIISKQLPLITTLGRCD